MTELSVGMMEMDDASRDQESLIKEANVDPKTYEGCMKYERQADEAEFGHEKGERIRKQTDGKRHPSKREASIGRRENRNYVIGMKKADAAGLAEAIYAITHSGKTRG